MLFHDSQMIDVFCWQLKFSIYGVCACVCFHKGFIWETISISSVIRIAKRPTSTMTKHAVSHWKSSIAQTILNECVSKGGTVISAWHAARSQRPQKRIFDWHVFGQLFILLDRKKVHPAWNLRCRSTFPPPLLGQPWWWYMAGWVMSHSWN